MKRQGADCANRRWYGTDATGAWQCLKADSSIHKYMACYDGEREGEAMGRSLKEFGCDSCEDYRT